MLAPACSSNDKASDAGRAAINQDASAIEPRIVVQLGHQTPVEAVQWVDGGRHIVSLSGDGALVFWDVASGAILDHAQVPVAPAGLSFQEMKPGAEPGNLAIVYHAVGGVEAAAGVCPTAARNAGGWCGYTLDLATRVVRPDNMVTTPDSYATPGHRDDAKYFPLSPDGKLRPAQNHADGQPGLFDPTDEHLQFADPTCISRERCRYGVNLIPVNGGAPIRLTGNPRSYFLNADIDDDGRNLVRVEGLLNDTRAQVETLDLVNGSAGRTFEPERAYHRIGWIGRDRYALFSEGYAATNDMPDALAGFPKALVVDQGCAAKRTCATIDSHWQMQPLDDAGSFVAAGSIDSCYRGRRAGLLCFPTEGGHIDDGNESEDPPAAGISIHDAGTRGWQLMDQPDWGGQMITAIRLSPDRTRLAVATRVWDRADKPGARQVLRLWMLRIDGHSLRAGSRELLRIDNAIAETRAAQFSDGGTIRELSFTPDGKRVIFTQAIAQDARRADLYIVDSAGAAPVRKIAGFSRRAVAAGDDRIFGLDTGMLIDTASGRPVARDMAQAPLVRAGWIKRSKMLWAATDDGTIRFWDGVDGTPQLTLYMFPGNRFFAVTPGGRYDTNLAPDTKMLRWLVPDAPWQSLGAQTFMRDFYEPALYAKLLDCRAARTCGSVFKQLPAIATLNRVMPDVRITGVASGSDASEALVSVEVREGVNFDAANGKTRSGIYNPRLFRNGRVVAMTTDEPDAVGDTTQAWRGRNRVGDGGPQRLTYRVVLPTGPGSERQSFSAYAFNEDRIKSETASYAYTRPAVAARQPRAFVVAIGIDDYDTPRFKLNYSVADARLISTRLETIPGFAVQRLVLSGERAADGTRKRISNRTIRRVLSLLASDRGRATTLKALADEDGVDASMIAAATPDDIVIVSFSGHGWADRQGNFYLIPSDGRWPDGAETPDLNSVFATADLSRYFRAINAGDITLIIDACHSSASIASGFKPGPMGDSGLGQLAYDKGIRILAATQADDVAMEDARLKQGLLTYALAAEGIDATGGKADLDGDGRIRLDEWLRYAVQRMPSLAEDTRVGQIVAAGTGARAITFHDLPADALKRRIQQPSLFDFNTQPSSIILRRTSP
jgi:WD40 repeat protein